MHRDNLTYLSRREWLKQMAALGALTALSPDAVIRAQAPANARRLDLHHHFGSPRWIKHVGHSMRGAVDLKIEKHPPSAQRRLRWSS